jgi:hypothetical protein
MGRAIGPKCDVVAKQGLTQQMWIGQWETALGCTRFQVEGFQRSRRLTREIFIPAPLISGEQA